MMVQYLLAEPDVFPTKQTNVTDDLFILKSTTVPFTTVVAEGRRPASSAFVEVGDRYSFLGIPWQSSNHVPSIRTKTSEVKVGV
jgi:hypothetical protein